MNNLPSNIGTIEYTKPGQESDPVNNKPIEEEEPSIKKESTAWQSVQLESQLWEYTINSTRVNQAYTRQIMMEEETSSKILDKINHIVESFYQDAPLYVIGAKPHGDMVSLLVIALCVFRKELEQQRAGTGHSAPPILWVCTNYTEMSDMMMSLNRIAYPLQACGLWPRSELCKHAYKANPGLLSEIEYSDDFENVISTLYKDCPCNGSRAFSEAEMKEYTFCKKTLKGWVDEAKKHKFCAYHLMRELREEADVIFIVAHNLINKTFRQKDSLNKYIVVLGEALDMESTLFESIEVKISLYNYKELTPHLDDFERKLRFGEDIDVTQLKGDVSIDDLIEYTTSMSKMIPTLVASLNEVNDTVMKDNKKYGYHIDIYCLYSLIMQPEDFEDFNYENFIKMDPFTRSELLTARKFFEGRITTLNLFIYLNREQRSYDIRKAAASLKHLFEACLRGINQRLNDTDTLELEAYYLAWNLKIHEKRGEWSVKCRALSEVYNILTNQLRPYYLIPFSSHCGSQEILEEYFDQRVCQGDKQTHLLHWISPAKSINNYVATFSLDRDPRGELLKVDRYEKTIWLSTKNTFLNVMMQVSTLKGNTIICFPNRAVYETVISMIDMLMTEIITAGVRVPCFPCGNEHKTAKEYKDCDFCSTHRTFRKLYEGIINFWTKRESLPSYQYFAQEVRKHMKNVFFIVSNSTNIDCHHFGPEFIQNVVFYSSPEQLEFMCEYKMVKDWEDKHSPIANNHIINLAPIFTPLSILDFILRSPYPILCILVSFSTSQIAQLGRCLQITESPRRARFVDTIKNLILQKPAFKGLEPECITKGMLERQRAFNAKSNLDNRFNQERQYDNKKNLKIQHTSGLEGKRKWSNDEIEEIQEEKPMFPIGIKPLPNLPGKDKLSKKLYSKTEQKRPNLLAQMLDNVEYEDKQRIDQSSEDEIEDVETHQDNKNKRGSKSHKPIIKSHDGELFLQSKEQLIAIIQQLTEIIENRKK